jgi:cardiolipin synthase
VSRSELELLALGTARAVPLAELVEIGPDRVRHLRDGDECFPAMLAAIQAARREVVAEFYWFGSDSVGRLFVDALSAKARDGCVVRVVYDAIGSMPVDADMFDDLRESGADVRAFHPLIGALTRNVGGRWFIRDHRKLLVCDGEVGFTGGLNIGRPWASRSQGGEGFRDDALEVQGPAAGELREAFYDTWRRVLRRRERTDPAKLPPDAARELRHDPQRDVWVIGTRRRPSRRAIRATYLRWINGAQRAIDIVNAYFVPDGAVRRALLRAARRGVRVRVLVPETSDLPFVQWACEGTLAYLVRHGVEAYAYRGAVLHSKVAVVDDELVTIGSYNLDRRSARANLEINLAARDGRLVALVRHSIEDDLARSIRWTDDVLRARGLLRRMLGWFALLFARWL